MNSRRPVLYDQTSPYTENSDPAVEELVREHGVPPINQVFSSLVYIGRPTNLVDRAFYAAWRDLLEEAPGLQQWCDKHLHYSGNQNLFLGFPDAEERKLTVGRREVYLRIPMTEIVHSPDLGELLQDALIELFVTFARARKVELPPLPTWVNPDDYDPHHCS